MKKTTFFISLIFLSLFFISCESRDATENISDLGTYTVGTSEFKIHKATLHLEKSSDPDIENRATFHFHTYITNTPQRVSLSVTYPYNLSSIDGEYTITGATSRSLDTWNTYFFETASGTPTYYRNLTQGTCTITKHSEDQYTVKFNFLPQGGSLVNGTFSGTLILE